MPNCAPGQPSALCGPGPSSSRRRPGRRPLRRAASVGVPACVLVLFLGCLAGCGRLSSLRSTGGSPISTTTSAPATGGHGSSGLTTYEVQPTATAAGLSGPDSPDVAAVDTAVPSNGELFLFLPGTGGQPSCCQDLLETAARTGFLAIGLTYDNSQAVGKICLDDLNCYTTVRQDDFDGSAPSSFADVSPANSIQSRVVDLLRYLAATHPSQGWDQFLDGSTPAWSKIVVSGHSQGGGDAAYIAKVRSVEGVVMLASDVDSTATSPPVAATYLTTGHLTPLDRYVGFDHVDDPYHDKIVADWTALGLQSFGPATSVDGKSPPFGNSHQLVSAAAVPPGPAPALATHDSSAVDVQTPLCPDGSPAYAPVWRYMMQVAGGLPLTSGPMVCTTS
jgi:hypothetical protein